MRNSFSHCPMCGTAYPKSQPEPFARHCQKCGYIYYENLRTATRAVLREISLRSMP